MENINHVVCEKRSYSREFVSHQHGFGQFLFPLQGCLDIQTKWQDINLTTDSIFYLPPEMNHNYRSADRNEFLILDIPLHYLPKDTKSMYIQADQQWESIRYLLLEESRNKDNNAALTDLAKYVAGKLHTANPPSIDYIHKHFTEPLRLETLAAIEHYHPAYYSAWFKKQTGKSLSEYIAELRLKKARTLLISTGRSITEISGELGFENASSFTRWFGKQEGIPPKHYRFLNKG